MMAPVVFFDIAGPDAGRLRQFYGEVFGWGGAPGGNFSTPVVSPLPATFRQDPAEKILYIGVDDIAATLQQVVAGGGTIDVPRFEVPHVAVLGLFRDPAGNRMGLVEMRAGKPIVP